jgi:hypothetical protein
MQSSYQRFRTSRRVWWRGQLARGALKPSEFLAEVPATDRRILVKSSSVIWRVRKHAIKLERWSRSRRRKWRRGGRLRLTVAGGDLDQ